MFLAIWSAIWSSSGHLLVIFTSSSVPSASQLPSFPAPLLCLNLPSPITAIFNGLRFACKISITCVSSHLSLLIVCLIDPGGVSIDVFLVSLFQCFRLFLSIFLRGWFLIRRSRPEPTLHSHLFPLSHSNPALSSLRRFRPQAQ